MKKIIALYTTTTTRAALVGIIICLAIAAFLPACTPASSGGSSATSATSEAQQKVKVVEGAEAPDFTFTTTDGQTANLTDYRGKVVLLNFWATWCGYCIQEMPAMQQIREKYSDVVVLAINRGDTTSEAVSFAEKSNYDFVWGLDEDSTISRLYPANGIPYSIIIDANGIIETIYEGSASDMYPYFERAVIAAGA